MLPVIGGRNFTPGTSVCGSGSVSGSVAAAARLDDDDRPRRVVVVVAAVARVEVAFGKVSGMKIPAGNDLSSGTKMSGGGRSSEVAEVEVIGYEAVVLVHLFG